MSHLTSLIRRSHWLRLACLMAALLVPGWLSSATAALTAADVPGPDGIVYPDWRLAGKPGGIPTNLVVRTSITNWNGFPNDGLDDASALEQAAAYTGSFSGGGVVTLPAGTFYLDRPVIITNNNVVLRGAGNSSTKVYFRYAPPVNAVVFYKPTNNATILPNSWVEIHADPTNLVQLVIKCTNTVIGSVTNVVGSWGWRYSYTVNGSQVYSKTGNGLKTLTGVAYYSTGAIRSNSVVVTVSNATDPSPNTIPSMLAAINFCGIGNIGSKPLLTADGIRGDTSLTLTNGHGILAGDRIELVAPRTARWDAEVENECTSGDLFRHYLYLVTAVNGNVVTLNQPLRIDYPIIDGSYVQKMVPLLNCGVEDFYLEQTKNIWTCGVLFSKGWECWAKGMFVRKPGRHALYSLEAKWCEIRNCSVDDAWWKGDGGTAYVGWERSYDCLMDGMTSTKMRHGPLVQWSAAGNVIRNSSFSDCDAQWHSGWTHENLFENLVIESNQGNGGYGYGMFASAPDDVQHGPNGPRNVVYNNDITSPSSGMWLGGQNREWLILHNRFATDSGQGIYAKDNSGDHIVEDNVFSLKNGINAIWLVDTNCTGIEVVSNKFFGVANVNDIVGGAVGAAVSQGNTTVDYLTPFSFSNPGFESALTVGWTNNGDGGMSVRTNVAALNGTYGLRVTDNATNAGSSLYSQPFSVTPGQGYLARFWARTISGSGLGVYLKFYDSGGVEILSVLADVPANSYWAKYYVEEVSPPNAVTAKLWIHSYSANKVTMDFDDFEFGSLAFDLANPGFENGFTFWSTNGDNGMSSVINSAKYSGTNGLHIVDSSTNLGSSVTSSNFPATPGKTYQVRFWGRVTSGTGLAVYLQFVDSGGATINPPTYEELPTNTTEWRQYICRGDAPTNAVAVRVWVHSYSNAQVTGDIDDLVLSEVEPRPVPRVGSIYAWQLDPHIFFPIANPGFESGITNWDNTGDAGMSVAITNSPHSGLKCLRVTDGVTNAGSALGTISYPVEPGKNYQTRFWAKAISGSGCGVYIQFFNSGGTNVGQNNVTISTTSTSWTQYTLNAVAPATAVTARVWVHAYIANISTTDFDDFDFSEFAILP